jgi:hypothetical protein
MLYGKKKGETSISLYYYVHFGIKLANELFLRYVTIICLYLWIVINPDNSDFLAPVNFVLTIWDSMNWIFMREPKRWSSCGWEQREEEKIQQIQGNELKTDSPGWSVQYRYHNFLEAKGNQFLAVQKFLMKRNDLSQLSGYEWNKRTIGIGQAFHKKHVNSITEQEKSHVQKGTLVYTD